VQHTDLFGPDLAHLLIHHCSHVLSCAKYRNPTLFSTSAETRRPRNPHWQYQRPPTCIASSHRPFQATGVSRLVTLMLFILLLMNYADHPRIASVIGAGTGTWSTQLLNVGCVKSIRTKVYKQSFPVRDVPANPRNKLQFRRCSVYLVS
jgi:hypothetical protein